MPTDACRTLQAVPTKDEATIDLRVEELHRKLLECDLPLRQRTIGRFFRTAYLTGYLDGLHETPPLTEEIPMLRYPQLFLP